ncbi:MAG: hypothetical protein C5B50_00305 [Verrucomicrobia bacterium]|nr:MAG: hypothetical protein C5B50_00305 [Verrucomicrobiota bacterium]
MTGVFGGGCVKLYLDGTLAASVPETGDLLNTSLGLVIGGNAHPVSGAYNRDIDDVRIYNRALSDSEALALYSIPEPCVNSLFLLCFVLLVKRRTRGGL